MPKEFGEMPTERFQKYPTGEKPTDAERAQTWLERRALEHGELSEFHHPIDVWYTNGEPTWSDDKLHNETADYLQAVDEHNDSVKEDERAVCFFGLTTREFHHRLEHAFGDSRHSNLMPDLVILDRSKDKNDYMLPEESAPLAHTYLQYCLQPIDLVRSAADKYYHCMRYNALPEKFIDPNEYISQELFDHAFHQPLIVDPEHTTKEYALEEVYYELCEDKTWAQLVEAVREYIEQDSYTSIEAYLTDEVLQRAIARTQAFDEEAIYSAHEDELQRDEGIDANSEIAYRKRIAELCHELTLYEVRAYAQQMLRQAIDSFRQNILVDEDGHQWTKRVVAPMVASVSPNVSFQRHALEHGADTIPTSLDSHDLEKLTTLVARTKDDWQSMAKERVQRFKRQFYERHQAELDGRSEMTADTQQELTLLQDILERQQQTQEVRLRILDVACGTGRITVPLSEHYDMTGLDNNEHFLKANTERSNGRVHTTKCDIINYKDAVEHEAYDAVTYTWHSFLEAHGIGNTLETLTSAWLALRPGGELIFDMPTRENPGMEDGWYEYPEKEGSGYVAYLMDEDELRFMVKMAGFDTESIEIHPWTSAPTDLYPEGMRKWTVVAHKPEHVPLDEPESINETEN